MPTIQSDLERGRQLLALRNPEEALAHFKNAFDEAIKSHAEIFAIDAAHMIAIAEPRLSKQNEWNLKAIALAEQSSDPKARSLLASLCDSLGWTYHDAGQYREALIQFQKALAARDGLGEDSGIRVAEWAVGRTYRSLNQLGEALKIQLRLAKEYERAGSRDSYVFEELGEIYEALNKPETARDFYELARATIEDDEWLKKNEPQRFARLVQKTSQILAVEA